MHTKTNKLETTIVTQGWKDENDTFSLYMFFSWLASSSIGWSRFWSSSHMLPRFVVSLSDIDAISISFNLEGHNPTSKPHGRELPNGRKWPTSLLHEPKTEPLKFPDRALEVKSPESGPGTTLGPSHCNSTSNPRICGGGDRQSTLVYANSKSPKENQAQVTEIWMPPQTFRENLQPKRSCFPSISARERKLQPKRQESRTRVPKSESEAEDSRLPSRKSWPQRTSET